jgi:hypothetical protein
MGTEGTLPRALRGGDPNSVSISAPVGGLGGSPFEDRVLRDLEVGTVRIWGGQFIDAVQLVYRHRHDPNQLSEGPKHGGRGGTLDRPRGLEITLQPGEFITTISGRVGQYLPIRYRRIPKA